jgi:hypothetical protein
MPISCWNTSNVRGMVSRVVCLVAVTFFGSLAVPALGARLQLTSTSISYGGGGFCSPEAVCFYNGHVSTDQSLVMFEGQAAPLVNGNWGCCGPDFRGTGMIMGPIEAGTVLAFRYSFIANFPLSFSANTGFVQTNESGLIEALLYYQVTNAIPGNGSYTILIDLKYQGPTTSVVSVFVPPGGTLVWTNPSILPGDSDGDCEITLADLAVVVNNWGTFGPFGDVNLNGSVGLDDVSEITSQWGRMCGQPSDMIFTPPPPGLHDVGSYHELVDFLKDMGAM